MDTYAIVLYFDKVTNASINEIIKNVAIISGNNYMVEVNIPPHITIGSFLSGDYSELCKGIENIVDHIERGTVKFDSIKAFEPRVMFMSPINDTILEQLNELVHDQFLKNFLPADNNRFFVACQENLGILQILIFTKLQDYPLHQSAISAYINTVVINVVH